MIGETLNHYRIGGQIGSGGMGAVYRAEDLKLHRDVALKVLPAELAGNLERFERFQREARAVAALNHPNIVTLFSVEEAGGRHFITMELVQGRALSQVIPAGGLSLDEFFTVALDLANVLATVHEQGIAHGALASSKVLLADAGAIKVTGFGLAWPGAGANEPTTAFQRDIAAWSLVGCEMLTGQRLRTADATRSLNQLALREDPDYISRWRPEVPVEVSRLISQCAQPLAPGTLQTAHEVGQALRDLQSRLQAGELTSLPLSPEAAQSRTTLVNWTLALVLLNLLFALLAFFYWKH